MNGYWKKLCRVNLTEKKWSSEEIDEATLELLMGGTALGAKILLEETPAKVDPQESPARVSQDQSHGYCAMKNKREGAVHILNFFSLNSSFSICTFTLPHFRFYFSPAAA